MPDYLIATHHSFAPGNNYQWTTDHSHSAIHYSCIVNLHAAVPVLHYLSATVTVSTSNHDFPCEVCPCDFQVLYFPSSNSDYMQAILPSPVVLQFSLLLPSVQLPPLIPIWQTHLAIPVSLQKPLHQAVQPPKIFPASGYPAHALLTSSIKACNNGTYTFSSFCTISDHREPFSFSLFSIKHLYCQLQLINNSLQLLYFLVLNFKRDKTDPFSQIRVQ